MLLPPLEVDLDVYEQQLAAALLDVKTHVYIDTSVMIWLYGLGESARSDFIDWVRNPRFAGRISVPVWAMHEFLGKVQAGKTNVFFPFDGQIKEFIGSTERIKAVASLLVDDPWLKKNMSKRGRDFYLKRLDRVFSLLGKSVSPLRTNLSAETVHNQLFPFFNDIALKSDIFSELASIQTEFDSRCEGRVPPGFEDRRKRGAGESEEDGQSTSGANRFGDLVFWKEVIAESKTRKSDNVVILSNDVKKDWVYRPQRYRDVDGRTKPNNQPNSFKRLYLASPLLAHEIQLHAGVKALHVVNIYQLVPVLQRRNRLSLDSLARATQIDFEARSAIDGASVVVIDDFALDAVGEVLPPVSDKIKPSPAPAVEIDGQQISTQALADKHYAGGADRETDQIIADLKTHNWYVQNPAVKISRVRLVERSASADQVFVLGRNIYQAACGGANEAIVFVQKLWAEIARLDSAYANLLVGGMFFEAYFDSNGKVRSKPKSDQLKFLLALQRNTAVTSAIKFIHERLMPYQTKFLLIPSPEPDIKVLSLTFEPDGQMKVLRAVRDGQLELTKISSQDFDRPLVGLLGDKSTTIERLLEVTAEYFCVLEQQLEIAEPEGLSLQVAGQLSFVNWGTHTDFDFQPADGNRSGKQHN